MADREAFINIGDSSDPDLSGDILQPGQIQTNSTTGNLEFNTLDEPISATFLRDVTAVLNKFKQVAKPPRSQSDRQLLLRDWDLWGPLVLCTTMAILLQGTGKGDNGGDGGPEFAEVFVIVWVGALVVTVNAKLLGGNVSIFQSVCVLGYCLFAPAISLIICTTLLHLGRSTLLLIIRLMVTCGAAVWAIWSSWSLLGQSQSPKRRALAGYPVCLFYMLICWIIVSHTG